MLLDSRLGNPYTNVNGGFSSHRASQNEWFIPINAYYWMILCQSGPSAPSCRMLPRTSGLASDVPIDVAGCDLAVQIAPFPTFKMHRLAVGEMLRTHMMEMVGCVCVCSHEMDLSKA